MAVTKYQVLNLYRQLLRESSKFSSYNHKSYFLRRVKEEFHKNKTESSEESVKKLLRLGEENLEMMKRQVVIGNLYKTDPLIIEKKQFRK
ncbi:hypothetical protein CHUAL_003686 [Chamberlinius hualienensis]